MDQAQFSIGQEVRFKKVSKKYARKGGVIKGIVDCYNLNKELCQYANELTTVKKFSDGNAGWDTLGGISVQADLDSTTIYEITPRVVIGAPAGDGSTGARQAVGRAVVASNKITKVLILDCGASYVTAQTVTFTDPNNTVDAPVQSFIGDGVLGQPTFVARGSDYVTASAIVTAQGTQATINAITQASPAVITTSAAHNFSTNDKVTFTGILGMVELNTGVR